jgi:hypothetical protein
VSALALDLGKRVGWARSNGLCGIAEFMQDDHGMALAMFTDWLEAMLDAEQLRLLCVERGFGGNNANGRLTTAMELTAHALAWSRVIARTDRSANEVRKWLVGFSRVGKPGEMSKAARSKLMDKAVLAAVRLRGFDPHSEHAADACALLACVENRQVRERAA